MRTHQRGTTSSLGKNFSQSGVGFQGQVRVTQVTRWKGVEFEFQEVEIAFVKI